MNAVANADVPKFTLITGHAWARPDYALCGRALKPNALLMWPNARAALRAPIGAPTGAPTGTASGAAEYAGAMDWARQLWCDMVIDPVQTRPVLAELLAMAGRTPAKDTQYAVFRM